MQGQHIIIFLATNKTVLSSDNLFSVGNPLGARKQRGLLENSVVVSFNRCTFVLMQSKSVIV